MTPPHSPLPWSTLHSGSVWDANGRLVCHCRDSDDTKGNAGLIAVSATNYEKMRKALEFYADPKKWGDFNGPFSHEARVDAGALARAALARAGAET